MPRSLWTSRVPTTVLIGLAVLAFACDRGGTDLPQGPVVLVQIPPRLSEILGTDADAPTPTTVVGSNFGTLSVPNASGKQAPLTIKSLSVKVDVVGRLARTEVTEVFTNHGGRQTEGVYEFTLPAGASVSRLAMDVNGQMMEGELVERDRARQIYTHIVTRRRDPALLEWQGGNRFKTRIFPIAPRSDKTVILTYEEILPRKMREVRYRYSMPNLAGEPEGSEMGHFSFALSALDTGDVTVSGYEGQVTPEGSGGRVSIRADGFKPTGPVEVRFTASAEPTTTESGVEVDGERLFMLDYVPQLPMPKAEGVRHLVIALDTSAGIGTPELARAKALTLALIKAMPPTARFNVVHGDYRIYPCLSHVANVSEAPKASQCLDQLDAAGGSNLDALLVRAAKEAGTFQGPATVVLISDGVATLGELDGDMIRAHFAQAVEGKDITLHTVAIGHGPNGEYLASLAGAMGGHALRMGGSDRPEGLVETLTPLLTQPLVRDVEVRVLSGQVDDLNASRPTGRLKNLARGQSLALLGKLKTRQAEIEVSGSYAGQPLKQTFTVGAGATQKNPLLRNFWARAKIAKMEADAVGRDKIVATSKRYGVMSQVTSFLVLENDAAYRRFQVERSKDGERKKAEANRQMPGKNLRKGDGKLQDLLTEGKPKPSPSVGKAKDRAPSEKFEATKAPTDDEVARPGMQEAPRPTPTAKTGGVRRHGAKRRGGFGGRSEDGRIKGETRRVRRPTPASALQQLEARLATLSWAERGTLMDLYLRAGRRRDADKLLTDTLAETPAADRGRATLALLATLTATIAYSEAFLAAALPLIERSEASEHLLTLVMEHHNIREDWPALQTLLKPRRPLPLTTRGLGLLSSRGPSEYTAALLEAWRNAGTYTLRELDSILAAIPRLAVSAERFSLLKALVVEQGQSERALIEALSEVGHKLKHDAEVDAVLMAHCGGDSPNVPFCQQWLTDKDSPEAHKLLTSSGRRWLAALARQRQQDVTNEDLIFRMVKLLDELGHHNAALRLLSELVEFTPHVTARRLLYAGRLVDRNLPVEACTEYAAAVMLDPAQRDTFRTMMELRRNADADPDKIKACVVAGVSNLPVHRDVSLVLTWEDKSADVDLHVVEAGGEEVWFQHKESAAGGLLYYDITDGYGPEIYVLGAGTKGSYKLSLVYYSGVRKDVEATLTILKHAGSPSETREVRRLKLPTADPDVQHPLGTLNL